MSASLLQFTKMHGLGNDFMVVDCIKQKFEPKTKWIKKVSNRHLGIGFDQLLLIETSVNPQAQFRYRIFNADGEEVSQCGNGARCFAKYVIENTLCSGPELCVETNKGLLILTMQEDGCIRVNMGKPQFQPSAIPFLSNKQTIEYELDVSGELLRLGVVSMGNPHALIICERFDDNEIARIGAALQQHPAFPQQVNVGFMKIHAKNHISLRVFERGVGETLACGSGACAAVVYGILSKKLANKVNVDLTGGRLQIEWTNPDADVIQYGPAQMVYTGQIKCDLNSN